MCRTSESPHIFYKPEKLTPDFQTFFDHLQAFPKQSTCYEFDDKYVYIWRKHAG